MKNTVIFDLDGLLIDSEPVAFQLYCDLTAEYDRHISLEEYIHRYSGKTAVDNMRTLINAYQLPLTIEDGLAFEAVKEKEYIAKGIPLKQGARELLSYLQDRGYKIVLASSSSRERAMEILTQNQAENAFDQMVFGTEVKRGKPHPDIFIKACEYAKEPPQNCLVLEDSEAGIQAAYAAGIDVICIPDMKIPAETFRKMTAAELSSLNDVIVWLEQEQA